MSEIVDYLTEEHLADIARIRDEETRDKIIGLISQVSVEMADATSEEAARAISIGALVRISDVLKPSPHPYKGAVDIGEQMRIQKILIEVCTKLWEPIQPVDKL